MFQRLTISCLNGLKWIGIIYCIVEKVYLINDAASLAQAFFFPAGSFQAASF
jgi:hypothetical protein